MRKYIIIHAVFGAMHSRSANASPVSTWYRWKLNVLAITGGKPATNGIRFLWWVVWPLAMALAESTGRYGLKPTSGFYFDHLFKAAEDHAFAVEGHGSC